MMIDTHCHVFEDEKIDLKNIMKNMDGNIVIFSGATKEDNENTIKAIKEYENAYGTIGFHPDEASKIKDEDINDLENKLNKKIIGIGEIGLDYYHNDNKEEQKSLFIKQLNLARKHNLPVVIHSREAALDTFEILKDYEDLKKVMHCYSYSLDMAYRFINIGCTLGIGGVLTFKNAKNIKEVVENIPLEKIVLETDSPYLTPEPFRGTSNQPHNIIYVAEKIAELKNIDIEKVYDITTKNACEIYNIKI